jgi:putative FmdB family regulatory protein
MPIYEYCCQDCQHIFEEWQKDYTERDRSCPICGARAKRMISSTAFILKGSGWYQTDYARASSNTQSSGNGNGGKQEGEGGSESTSESKSDSSSDGGGSADTASSDQSA